MSTKVLNIVIAISLFGIIAAALVQSVAQGPSSSANALNSQKLKPTTIPTPKDELAECSGPYVNIAIGSQWTYTITSETDKKPQTTILTSTLAKKSAYDMEFEHVVKGSNEKTTSRLICRQSGIYGLPVSVFNSGGTLKIIPSNLIESLNSTLQFIPDRKVYKGKNWTSIIDISGLLPIKINDIKPQIAFTVIEERNYTIAGSKETPAIVIKTSAGAGSQFDVSSFLDIHYTLAENIGLVESTMKATVPTKGTSTIKITLTRFKPS